MPKIILKTVAHEIIDGIREAEENGRQIEAIALTHEEYVELCDELEIRLSNCKPGRINKFLGYDIFVGSPGDYEFIHGHQYAVFKKTEENGNVSILRDRISVKMFGDDDEDCCGDCR